MVKQASSWSKLSSLKVHVAPPKALDEEFMVRNVLTTSKIGPNSPVTAAYSTTILRVPNYGHVILHFA